MPMALPNRFWRKIRREASGCWAWIASLDSGYGVYFPAHTEKRRAHRVAYEALVGPVPAGLQLDHLCRNRSCVNPAHLEAVSGRMNVLRGKPSPPLVNAQRTDCSRGHMLSGRNLYRTPDGRRHCKTCNRDANRRYRERAAFCQVPGLREGE